jgi:two-component system cell cycle sensor histidine kinase/response regulator CckA
VRYVYPATEVTLRDVSVDEGQESRTSPAEGTTLVSSTTSRWRARISALGIRERLVLLVLAMLLPWVALFATTYVSYERDRDRDTRARLNDLAAQVGARVDDQLASVAGVLLAAAQAASTDSIGIAGNDTLLRRLRVEMPPYFDNIALWGIDGRNIGSSEVNPSVVREMDVAEHRFFRGAIGSPDLVVGRPMANAEASAWSLTLARRIRHGSTIGGAVSATIRLDGLARFLTVGGASRSDIVTAVVNDEGTVIAHIGGDTAARLVGQRITDSVTVRELRTHTGGVEDGLILNGVGQMIASRRVNAVPWLVFVGAPTGGGALAAEPEWKYLILFGAISLGGALFLATLVAARIVDPLRRLTADAARLGAGDLAVRTDVRAAGEVGELASSLNQMAATLQSRTAALAASEERHRLAALATNDVIWDWDVRASTVEWNEGAGEAFRIPQPDLGRTIEWWSSRIHPDDRDATVASLTDALDSTAKLWTAEYRFECGDGTYAEVLDRGYMLREPDGTPRRLIGSMLNLTERRAAERERDRFFSLSADMFGIASFNGRFVRVNPAFCDTLGYDVEELLATPIIDLVHPDDRTAAVEAALLLATGHVSQRYENRVLCKDGSYKWLAWTAQSADKEQGLVYAVARDVTEGKRAEERLRASEEWYRLLFDANPLPLWVYDIETLAFLAVNDAAVKHYGYSRAEFLAMRITDIRPEEDVPKVLAAARAPDRPDFEGGVWRHRTKDGRTILVEVVTHAIRVLDRPARLTLAHDVTERKRAERELRETNDTLQTLIQASPLAIVTTDITGVVSEWNVAAERTFGWVAGDVIGRPIPIVPAEQLEEDMRRMSISGEHSFSGYETRCVRKDGSLVDVYVSTALLRGVGGVMGTVWVMADVTERKEMEEQLRQAQKMDAVGQLAGGVAHDFNNLLTVITSYGQFLLNALPEQDPRRSDAHQITQAAARAASLTRQLLAFSRRQVLQPQVLDLNEVIGDMEKLLRRVISEDISLVTQFENGIGAVRADRGQIEQVVMNLVVNARDAMPSGGVLAISTRVVHIDAAYARRHAGVNPGRHVVFSVRDTGIGMDAATQERIFEPFFTTKAKGKGTGLGLSTVYGIVRQSGGHMDVRSAPGRGTTFDIMFPQVAGAMPAKAEHGIGVAMPRGTETVLVVEDEEAVRHIVRRVLEEQGYSMIEARDGHEALRICAQRGDDIDLVLSDVIMPGMGGRQLARALATTRPHLPVLFMSGYNDDGELGGGASDPSSGVLAKPFTAETLARQVREALDRRVTASSTPALDAQTA